ncbi:type II toxin-antitoxin system VapC family toxin [Candidatus Binatia bacterium]|nr:type II toxin-antitoxin system VapC family toxin [Candidatus Binatia bacterium]
MSIAVDTSVLIAIATGEAEATEWLDVPVQARRAGDVVICDVVAAEFYALLLDDRTFHDCLTALGIVFSPTSIEAARRAGRIVRAYRREGGPREHPLPDFPVGARAEKQADGIAAVDRGYLRRYFPRLKVVQPP